MAGGSERLGESIETRGELAEKAYSLAWKAHKTPNKQFLLEKVRKSNPSEVIISFPGSGAVKDWYSNKPFGETEVNLDLFPSLKSIGNNEVAKVNEAFHRRFSTILAKSSLEAEVDKAMRKQKQIVFTGHSSGAPVAILATLWTLEKYLTPKSHGGIHPLCVTFCSPLVGNHIFSHALRRENWSCYFKHYVMRYDIVPRIFLAPLSTYDQRFEAISQFFNPKSKSFMSQSIGRATATSDFYSAVMSNAATVTGHAACKLMGCTDVTLETIANFIPLSPYRPFGTYIFCTGSGKQIVTENPDAALQLLFFSAQVSTESETAQIGNRSLQEHVVHVTRLQQTLGMQNVVYMDQLENIPLTDDASRGDISMAINDLGLSTTARLCLLAAAELELRRCNNEDIMKNRKDFVEEKIMELEKYRETREHQRVCYYDAFKVQEDPEDFKANVHRLELAGVWDEIIEKLWKHELPDDFEGKDEWVELGKRFLRLVEPLDIANYYRHLRHHECGSYINNGRPRRYRYTQRWLEHAERRRPEEAYSEFCFWAEVEDLCNIASDNNGSFEDVKERVVRLEVRIKEWVENKAVDEDVFLEGSTLVKWWKALPPQHKQESLIRSFIQV